MSKELILIVLIISCYIYEFFSPLNPRKWDKEMVRHGINNVLIVFIATIVLKLFILGLTFLNYNAFEFQYSLLRLTGIGGVTASLLCITLFDLAIWFQHKMFHRFNSLWALHRVHHSDQFLDTSSGLRFHPVEILLSMIIKLILITLVGISIKDFMIFEILLSGFAIFNHSNLKLPKFLEKILKYIVVTPEVHQVHHSDKSSEMHNNFGFNLVIWDRLFGTYLDYTELQENFKMGLKDINYKESNSLKFLLKMPLGRK